MIHINNILEELFFRVVMALPERWIPTFLFGWLDRYIARRIKELQMQSIRLEWQEIALEKKLEQIRQQDTE